MSTTRKRGVLPVLRTVTSGGDSLGVAGNVSPGDPFGAGSFAGDDGRSSPPGPPLGAGPPDVDDDDAASSSLPQPAAPRAKERTSGRRMGRRTGGIIERRAEQCPCLV